MNFFEVLILGDENELFYSSPWFVLCPISLMLLIFLDPGADRFVR